MLGQNFKQKQTQTASPRQIQLMQLVQLPVLELEQRIKEELESNPTLEEGAAPETEAPDGPEPNEERETEDRDSDFDEDYLQQYMEDDPTSYQDSGKSDTDYAAPGSYTADENSFFEYLDEQLKEVEFETPLERLIARQIIGNLDDDGYLTRKLTAIADDLLINQNLDVRVGQIKEVLRTVQTLLPIGIAARDLRECLLLQLNYLVDTGDDIDDMRFADIVLARRIMRDHFDLFSKKHYDKLIEKLDVDRDELRDALSEILKLNPKPASSISGRAGGRVARTIVPDFILTMEDGELNLRLTARTHRTCASATTTSGCSRSSAKNRKPAANSPRRRRKRRDSSAKISIPPTGSSRPFSNDSRPCSA